MRRRQLGILVLIPVILGLLVACGGGGGTPPLPSVTNIEPASGGVAGGTLVEIAGTGFQGGVVLPVVLVGGSPATDVVVLDDVTLACTTPPGAAGSAAVHVATEHGAAEQADAFTYHPAPTLTAVDPDLGPLGGGAPLTFTGTGFVAGDPGDTTLHLGGAEITGFVIASDTTITCFSPALPGYGTVDAVLSNRNGEALLEDAYTCVPAPSVTAIDSDTGPAGGFTRVTITGDEFDVGVLEVAFGTTPATAVEVLSATSLTCLTPESSAGLVDVSVTTWGGEATLPMAYTYTTWAPDDPLFQNQWHLENTAQHAGSTIGEDAAVVPVWDWGYTGLGVRVGVVDDGLELLHEDLAGNVVSGSWDYGDDDADPTRERHGTSVAGVIAAVGGNEIGVTGAAPNAKVVGFAVLTAGTTDADFADALARDVAITHAYNNSWGSPAYYNGVLYGYAAAPDSMHAAVLQGLTTGRGGFGSVYLKAAGNSTSLSAHFDGTNGIRGMNVIGAVNADGTYSSYSQPGACVLVSAPSNGASPHPGITTTDRTGSDGYSSTNYTSTFGGTSSATPLVTGVVALLLEANPTLRWWEVPVLLAQTARTNDPSHADWATNGAGYDVNHQYGFGVIDAYAAVDAARTWVPLDGLVTATASATVSQTVTAGDATGVTSTIAVGADTGIDEVHRATVRITLDHPIASDLDLVLTSPDGTTSELATSIRTATTYTNSLSGMPLISCRHLGESAEGTWSLTVRDGEGEYDCIWSSWTLELEGEGVPSSTALTVSNAATATRPARPATPDDGEIAFFDGSAWRLARRDVSLLAEWHDVVAGSMVGRDPAAETAVVQHRGFTIWRLREGTSAADLLRRLSVGVAVRTGTVYRDGREGRGRMRVLTGRLTVRYAEHASDPEIERIEARHGLVRVRRLPCSTGASYLYQVAADDGNPIRIANVLLDVPGVAQAAPDWWTHRVLD